MLCWEKDIEERNWFLMDEELEVMFFMEGYKILEFFVFYVFIRIFVWKFLVMLIFMGGILLYVIFEEDCI